MYYNKYKKKKKNITNLVISRFKFYYSRIFLDLIHPFSVFMNLVPASAPRLVYYPVCGMMHIKEPLLLIGKSSLCDVATAGFLSHYQNGPLPYV